jgi:hypothetical protein
MRIVSFQASLFLSQDKLSDCPNAFIVHLCISDVKTDCIGKTMEHSGPRKRTGPHDFAVQSRNVTDAARDEAIRRARLFERFNLAWIEEPLPETDVEGHVRLANHTSIPVAVGESLYPVQHFSDYPQRGGCSVVQVDVARIGGITP